jgi:hypothetical protein
VRLARLLDFEIPKKPAAQQSDKRSFTFYGLMVEKLSASLTMLSGQFAELAGGGRIELGSGESPAFRDLEISGHLSYHREDPKPSSIAATCPELHVGISELAVAGLAVDSARLSLRNASTRLELDHELKPVSLQLELGGLTVSQLRADLGSQAP